MSPMHVESTLQVLVVAAQVTKSKFAFPSIPAQSTNCGRKSPPPKVFSKSAISISIHSSLTGSFSPGATPASSPSNSPSTSPAKPASPPSQDYLSPVSANKVLSLWCWYKCVFKWYVFSCIEVAICIFNL